MGNELDRIPAIPLDALRVPTPDAVNCISLRYQVAQKLHACTEVFDEGRENDRFRDVIDILLVEDLLRDIGLARARDACINVSAHATSTAGHRPCPSYESWRTPFAELARANRFTPLNVDQAAARPTALIASIDVATVPDGDAR